MSIVRTLGIGLALSFVGCGASATQTAHMRAIEREASACAGITPAQAQGPFVQAQEILSVEPLVQVSNGHDVVAPRVIGARAIFRATRGTTAEWLQRVVACELARDEALGHPQPGTEQFPETVPGAEVGISPVVGGFAVDVGAADEARAQEILRRARALAPSGG